MKGNVRMRTRSFIKKIISLSMLLFLLSGCSGLTGQTTGSSEAAEQKTAESERIQENQQEETRVPETRKVRLAVTGDLMCHSWQYEDAYNSASGEYEFDYNFKYVKKYLKDADYTIGNFETTLGGDEIGPKDFPCFNTPDSFAEAVKHAGYDLVTTANNHCMDQGDDSLKRTLRVLDNYGLEHIGTYASEKASKKVFVKELQGIKIAFLTYTYGTNGLTPGEAYYVNMLDEARIEKDIRKAKKQGAEFVIVFPHQGTEYEETPSDFYKEQYQRILKMGADMILASHPHVLQPIEYVKVDDEDGTSRTCFIAYSLGNFLSSQRTIPRDTGVILNITIEKTGEEAPVIKKTTVIPTWVQFRNPDGSSYITVRSICDMLSMKEEEKYATFAAADIQRAEQANIYATKQLLGKEIPAEKIKQQYKIGK